MRSRCTLRRIGRCPRILWRLLLSLGFFALTTSTHAQTGAETTKVYATLDRQAVTYRGPVGPANNERSDGPVVIGMILPLKGPQQAEGKALVAAAQLAIEEEQAQGPLPDGRRLNLVVRDESGPWGQASTEILKLFEQDHALAILTSANGTSAHLAEQIANKISIPILTLASDPSTTQANVPWLFRLGPSDTDQASIFCRRIYSALGLKRVLLVAQMDHDGRVGSEELEKAAKRFSVNPPMRFEVPESGPNLQSLRELLQTREPEAIVVWTDAPQAEQLLPLAREARPSTPVFLCRKAAQLNVRDTGEWFTVGGSSKQQIAGQENFRQLYLAQSGTNPGFAAEEIHQAVHMLATALRTTGANRVLLRDYLADEGNFRSPMETMAFDPAGNRLQEFRIVDVRASAPVKP